MQFIHQVWTAHAQAVVIGGLVSLYFAVVSWVAANVPRPGPGQHWYWRLLYDLLVDTMSLRASAGQVGVRGGPWNFPLVPSRPAAANPTPAATKLLQATAAEGSATVVVQPSPYSMPPRSGPGPGAAALLLLFLACGVSACVGAQRDTMLAELTLAKGASLTYRTIEALDQSAIDDGHAAIAAGDVAGARSRWTTWRAASARAIAGANAADDLLGAVDAARSAATKGAADWSAYTDYLPQVTSMAAQLAQLVADLKKAMAVATATRRSAPVTGIPASSSPALTSRYILLGRPPSFHEALVVALWASGTRLLAGDENDPRTAAVVK